MDIINISPTVIEKYYYYIFDNGGNCVSIMDGEPNNDDLASRNEVAYKSTELFSLNEASSQTTNGITTIIKKDIPILPPSSQQVALYQAYNAFITYARSLNLQDKATMEDFQNAALSIEQQAMTTMSGGDMTNGMAQFANAIKIPLMALGLINNITQAGGKWDNIVWTDNI